MIDDIVHFTGSEFFVRKEILCVLENFKNSFQEELNKGELRSLQMVLMGSPGTGKSCILVLLCFHVAVPAYTTNGKTRTVQYVRGVQDRNNAKQYVDVLEWIGCVMSKYVLQHLGIMTKPEFFTRLMEIAKEMNDDRLKDAALEAYFHALVRHQGSIRVEYCKYDNVDRSTVPDQEWKDIMNQEVGSIEVKKASVANCEGTNKDECVTVMKNWAANPSKMDYWTPDTNLCETIDAVARWTFPDGVERFCFLQLTKATKHKCDETILWELAQPFLTNQLLVCYIALLPYDPEGDKRSKFRLDPVVIRNEKGVHRIPLYISYFQVTTSS